MSYYFVIISPRDSPLYEVHLSSKPSGGGSAGLSAGLGGFGGGLFGGASTSTSTSAQSSTAAAAANWSSDATATTPKASLAALPRRDDDDDDDGNIPPGGAFNFSASLSALASGLRGLDGLGGGASAFSDGAAGATAAGATATAATPRAATGLTSYTWRSTLQMIAHSSLDSIYDKSLCTSQMYLRTIDRTHQQFVSCFLLPNRYFFVILHEHKHEEGIRNFFLDAWELLLKTFINPLHDPLNPIRSPAFDTRIRASARRHL
ncbi:TRAPP 20 K subunit [Ceraceosorus bombacis]|uniref:TRAPP 20 K subunit n=1 Tax=Ceraceosorus bombacis TaxID=401625 RepID=A0A0P1B8L7_9BASI|nr:TRAPP 20 K subunit [Ceraceosorus bombacis]